VNISVQQKKISVYQLQDSFNEQGMKERESMSNHQNKISQAKEFQREQVAEVGGT
jgi:hypothetical protein